VGLSTASPVALRERLLRSLDRIPPFSPILSRVLATLAREQVHFGDVANLIEKDIVLAGNVLRTANSALYGFSGTINSVRHAVSILGFHKVHNMALALSVTRAWIHPRTSVNWSAENFNLHSVAVATLADLLVQRVPADYAEGAFTAGLFHDLGRLLMAAEIPLEYDALVGFAPQGGKEMEEGELEATGVTHAELSGAALARWNLPLPIQNAVRFHHSPEETVAHPLPLGRIVRAADQCVNALGLSVHPKPPARPESALEELGLRDRVPRLLEEFHAELEAVRSFL